MTYETLAAQLKEKNIRPSYQRIRILMLLLSVSSHPTADTIYHELKSEIPALSKSTVYNTLLTLTAAGLVKMVRIEENATRFDGTTAEHGHFQCQKCGTIQNFAANMDAMVKGQLAGCRVIERHIVYRGICRDCLAEQEREESK
ncbi:MAG: Fur family transcriptional regulator [Bacillota bacterium]|nr:Fur family transcriptional regulator [Bacillota bacterium]